MSRLPRPMMAGVSENRRRRLYRSTSQPPTNTRAARITVCREKKKPRSSIVPPSLQMYMGMYWKPAVPTTFAAKALATMRCMFRPRANQEETLAQTVAGRVVFGVGDERCAGYSG